MKVRNVINTSRESVSSTLSPLNNNELTRSPLMSTNTYTPPDSFDIQASLREWLNNMSWEEYALLRKEDEQCIYSGSSNYPDSASNWELATRANTGRKRPEHATVMKIKTKEYWDSLAGMEKRKRLSERNRQVKSEQIKQAWKDGKMVLPPNRKDNKSEEHKRKIGEGNKKTHEYCGEYYHGWDKLLKETGVSKHLYNKYYTKGINPTSYFRKTT